MNNNDERDSAEEQAQTVAMREEQENESLAENMREDGFRFIGRHFLRSDTEDTRTEGLWDSLLALLFGAMVPLTDGVVKHYHSDLYHDAHWLAKHVRDEMTLYYAVRDTGTSLGDDRDLVAYMGHEHLYRVDLVKETRSYGERWTVAIGIESEES